MAADNGVATRTLINPPGNRPSSPLSKGFVVSTLIVLLAIFSFFELVVPHMLCFVSVAGSFQCSERGGGAKEAEASVVQAAIDTFMTDNSLREVTPSTSGAGGEKINLRGTQFHATLSLVLYIRDTPTYCYQWQRNGTISQYDVDDDGNCAGDADQLFPQRLPLG